MAESRQQSFIADVERRLPEFTEYRLADTDAAGINVQLLSHTVPGVQAGTDAATARDHARFASDYLARVVAEYPVRLRGCASLPTQEPEAAAKELDRCLGELGPCGALVNDHFEGHYLDGPQYDPIRSALEDVGCRCTCIPAFRRPTTGSTVVPSWEARCGPGPRR